MYMHYIRTRTKTNFISKNVLHTRTKTNFISKNVLHHYEKEIPKIALKSPLKPKIAA